ncbi:MAG: PLP-dependent aspartate aminotransferase family protein [Myxococcales bacterium]
MSTSERPGLATLAVHSGTPAGENAPLTTPIVQATTHRFASAAQVMEYAAGGGESPLYMYSRDGNPTVRAAERKVAALDGAEDAALFGSGMAAVTTTLLELLKAGDHVVMTADCYRRTRQFVRVFLSRYGIEHTLVEPGDLPALRAALRPGKTKLILSESPTNPYLRVADLPALAAVRDSCPGANLMIDSTFATPVNQRPLAMGADLVIHSCTKYHGGHNDLLAGAVCGRAPLIAAIRDLRGVLGGVLDANSAFLLIRGIKTLALRVERQNQTALAVAEWLERHPGVERVWYPGLPSHPDHAVARAQMSGFGGVVSFQVRGGLDQGSRLIDACKLATLAPSLGGVETLIEQPSLMSYYELTTAERAAIGIQDNLIRLSIGIEERDDIVNDLAQALEIAVR